MANLAQEIIDLVKGKFDGLPRDQVINEILIAIDKYMCLTKGNHQHVISLILSEEAENNKVSSSLLLPNYKNGRTQSMEKNLPDIMKFLLTCMKEDKNEHT